MRNELSSWAGSSQKPNEDWAGATNRIAVVLDGLTAPSELGTGCIHGVPWYVEKLGTALLVNLTDESTSMQEALAKAITDVAALHSSTCDLDNTGTPSATVLALRLNADVAEWLVLADCTLALDCVDGLRVVSDDRVSRVNRDQHDQAVQAKVGTKEHESYVRLLVEAQRKIRNTPGGYWIAGSNPAAAYESICGSVSRNSVRRAALLTDGAARLHEFGLADWEGIFELLDTAGTDGLISAVRSAEESDPRGERWPRYKTSDDATVVHVVPLER